MNTPEVNRPRRTIYYGRQGFMLFDSTLVHDRTRTPYRRPSASLMFSLNGAFVMETGADECVESRAMLIAPDVVRRRMSVHEGDIVICDLSTVTQEFRLLEPLLKGAPVRQLDVTPLAHLQGECARARRGELSPAGIRELLHQVIFCFTGKRPSPLGLHPRIAHALRLIEKQPLHAVSLPGVAEQVHLSPSRLRHLFREQTGSSFSHYVRWDAVWKATWLWTQGRPWAKAASEAGFYDRAHFNRAFNALFGVNPSTLSDPDGVLLIRCECAESADRVSFGDNCHLA